MTEFNLTKKLDGLYHPIDDGSLRKSFSVPVGHIVKCKHIQPRNYEFHKKYMKLVRTAYDNCALHPIPINGREALPSFDTFRKDLVVMAGFYDPVVRFDNSLKKIPKSISFDNMKEEEFQELYRRTIDAIFTEIFPNYEDEDKRMFINEIDEFI